MMFNRPLQLRPAATRGFSFVEILFAIGVLGIGFIMLAAIFPVGLLQTKLSLDETASAANARSMAAQLQQLGQVQVQYTATPTDLRALFPDTFVRPIPAAAVIGKRYPGQVRTLNDPRPFTDLMTGANADRRQFNMWRTVADSLIQPGNDRSASIVLFKRDAIGVTSTGVLTTYAPASTAQVIVVNAQVANQANYTDNDVKRSPPVSPPKPMLSVYNLEPRPVAVQIVKDDAAGTYVASFFSIKFLDGAAPRGGYPNGNGPNAQSWDSVLDGALGTVEEGAYIVISDDRIDPAIADAGRLNGRIFRVGGRRPELGVYSFDLAPGYAFTPDPGADGFFNTTARPSTDDILGVGVGSADLSSSQTQSTLTYAKQPNGANGPNASGVTLVGASANNMGAVALVLGKGFADSSGLTPTAASGYVGPVQDVSAYTTFVTVPNP